MLDQEEGVVGWKTGVEERALRALFKDGGEDSGSRRLEMNEGGGFQWVC
jgi:hypothetical protein